MTAPPSRTDSLRALRIAITRTSEQSGSLVDRLRELGAQPVVYPAIRVAPPDSYDAVDAALRGLDRYDWIVFTSVNGVKAFLRRSREIGLTHAAFSHLKIATVGETTAQSLGEFGLSASMIPKTFIAHALADALIDLLSSARSSSTSSSSASSSSASSSSASSMRLLLPRADLAKSDLPDTFRRNGMSVDEVIAYRTLPGEGITDLLSDLRSGTLDAVTFASSSGIRYLTERAYAESSATTALSRGAQSSGSLVAGDPTDQHWFDAVWRNDRRPAVFCIGPVTAATARTSGLPVDAVAEAFDADGLLAVMANWFAARSFHS